MEARSLRYVCSACDGQLLRGSAEALVSRICTDSRVVKPGDLFFALRGDKFDGHSFLTETDAQGVAAVVVDQQRTLPSSLSCAVIAVDDARRALGRLGAKYRTSFNLPIVAVGGSNGKTTTKELLAAALREKMATLWNESSFNNDIGVPLTLLNLTRQHQVAVVEVGTNHPGELAPLLRIIQPQLGIITSIGREHLEFFGDLPGVVQEEGWLAEMLPTHGKLFINGDTEWVSHIEKRTRASVIRAGLGRHNDWRAGDIRLDGTGVVFHVTAPERDFCGDYRVNLVGRHQVGNALLAMAVAQELGLCSSEVRSGLANCLPSKMRLQLWENQGVQVLDDAYNANADSMIAALETLRDLPCSGNRVAVLGDMAELGEQTAAAHTEIGRTTAALGVNRLVAVGRWAHTTAEAARAAGLQDVREFADVESAAQAMTDLASPGDVVLIKASRSIGLERIGEALRSRQ